VSFELLRKEEVVLFGLELCRDTAVAAGTGRGVEKVTIRAYEPNNPKGPGYAIKKIHARCSIPPKRVFKTHQKNSRPQHNHDHVGEVIYKFLKVGIFINL
jgi:hypothetical protein